MANFEWHTGKTIADIRGDKDIPLIRTLVWALCLDEKPQITPRAIGGLSDLPSAFTLALKVVTDSMPRRESSPGGSESETARWHWMDIWAKARLMGIPSEEFWGFTPAQWAAISRADRDNRQEALFGASMICSTLANVNQAEGEIPFPADYFMPGEAGEKARAQRKQDEEDTLAMKMEHVKHGMAPKK